MPRARPMLLLAAGMLFSTTALADNAKTPGKDAYLSTIVGLYLEALRSEAEYTSPSRLSQSFPTLAYSSPAEQPIANLDFRKSGGIDRVRKLRALSFLTLAEVGGTRMFLGVNRKGLVGLHFRAMTRYGDERCLEVARMPYLGKNKPYSSSE